MYQQDRQWGDGYTEQVMGILKRLIVHCVVLSIAPTEEDNKHATDLTITLDGGFIAVRLRRPNCTRRDLTIRSSRSSGAKTELAKIKEGFASRYFYGWTNTNHVINEWILVDLDKMRSSGLIFTPRKDIPNGDGTFFVCFALNELSQAGCLIETQLLPNHRPTQTKNIPSAFETMRQKIKLSPEQQRIIDNIPFTLSLQEEMDFDLDTYK